MELIGYVSTWLAWLLFMAYQQQLIAAFGDGDITRQWICFCHSSLIFEDCTSFWTYYCSYWVVKNKTRFVGAAENFMKSDCCSDFLPLDVVLQSVIKYLLIYSLAASFMKPQDSFCGKRILLRTLYSTPLSKYDYSLSSHRLGWNNWE